MYIGMMDEDLQRVLLFLMDTLSKIPGWAHQGMLKQELLGAPIDGSLHRMLGSSSAETFAEFLKCFPAIFCINSNQLVQLCSKNGSISELSTLNLIGGGGNGGGTSFLKHDDCGLDGRSLSNMGALQLGIQRKPLEPPHHMEWNVPMSIVPETGVGGGGGGKLSGYLSREQQLSTTQLCGIPTNYATGSSVGIQPHRLHQQPQHHRGGAGSGWDPVVAHSLPDLQQSFLNAASASSSSSLSSDAGRMGHLANGWDRRPAPTAVPNCQLRFDGGPANTRLQMGHQRYSWENPSASVASHSLTDSLKNFTISADGYSPPTPSSQPPVTVTGSISGGGDPSASVRSQSWLQYTSHCLVGEENDVLDDFVDHHGSGDGSFLRPMASVWDEAIGSTTPPPTVPQPPQPPPAFLTRNGNSHHHLHHHHPSPLAINSHLASGSFKGWDKDDEDEDAGRGGGAFSALLGSANKQYYKWKGGSASPTMETDVLSQLQLEDPGEPEVEEEEEGKLEEFLEPKMVDIIVDEVKSLDQLKEPEKVLVPSIQNPVVTGPSGGEGGTTPAKGAGGTLSYAEALRSNTQRRRAGSESAVGNSGGSCPSSNLFLTTSAQSTKPTAGSGGQSTGSAGDRPGKSRRSLDGRCGKVEVLTSGDGSLRLGNGKVHFDKGIFYDGGKPVADLRNVLKPNDTVYFDAVPDGGNGQEWKATLAWVGKKPRSTCSSSPTCGGSATVSRATYRCLSEGNAGSVGSSTGGSSSSAGGGGIGGGGANGVRSSSSGGGGGGKGKESTVTSSASLSCEATVEGNGEVVILFAHFGFIRRGKKFKENVHFNRNVFYASGNRVKELTDVLKEGSTVNYTAVPSDKKSCKWKAVLVWTGSRPKV